MAVGMKRHKLVRLVSTELFFICSIGLVAGMMGSIPVIAYYHFHPIEMTGSMAEAYAAFGMEPVLPVAWRVDYIIQQAINVGMIVVVALVYPMYNMYKIDLAKDIRR